jgi:excisionase family DNA binding protein
MGRRPKDFPADKYMSREEAGRVLHTQSRVVLALIKSGELRGMQRGTDWYVERSSVDEYLARN